MSGMILEFSPGAFFEEFMEIASARIDPVSFAETEASRNSRYAVEHEKNGNTRTAAVYRFWAVEWGTVSDVIWSEPR